MKTDAEIYKAVIDEVNQEPILKTTVIGIVVQKQVVTLYGFVNEYEKKICRCKRGVPG